MEHEAMAAEIERLRRDCAEAYQAVGNMADALGYWDDASDADKDRITELLDNLSAAADGEPRPHEDLLPFSLSGWRQLTARARCSRIPRTAPPDVIAAAPRNFGRGAGR